MKAGHEGKAQWQTLLILLGQNCVMACLLPKCAGGKDSKVLKNQRHMFAVTLRMEKGLPGVPQGALL